MVARLGHFADRARQTLRGAPLLWAAVLAGALVGASAIFYTLHIAAADVDASARAHEEQLVGLRLRQAEIRRTIVPQVIWDDAVRHLDLAFDRAWADRILVEFFTQTAGYELVYLLDRDGRPVVAHAEVGDADPTFRAMQPTVAALLADVRAGSQSGLLPRRSGQQDHAVPGYRRQRRGDDRGPPVRGRRQPGAAGFRNGAPQRARAGRRGGRGDRRKLPAAPRALLPPQ